MLRRLSLVRDRLRRRRPAAASPEPSVEELAATAAPAVERVVARAPESPLRGLGEPPAATPQRDQAEEAELDTLRGELVRELDRLAAGDDGSASLRRAAG